MLMRFERDPLLVKTAWSRPRIHRGLGAAGKSGSDMIMGERAVIEQSPPVPVPPARGDDSVVAAISAPQAAALLALARTIHQFHTYPATSPLCIDAIAACRKAL